MIRSMIGTATNPKSAIALTAVPMIDAEAGVLRNLSVVGSPHGRNPGRRQ
jgi:hypothetical protein